FGMDGRVLCRRRRTLCRGRIPARARQQDVSPLRVVDRAASIAQYPSSRTVGEAHRRQDLGAPRREQHEYLPPSLFLLPRATDRAPSWICQEESETTSSGARGCQEATDSFRRARRRRVMVERYTQEDGRRLYEEERARRMADPDYRAIYEEEGQKKEL